MWKTHLHSEYMVIKFSWISTSYMSNYRQRCILIALLYIYSSEFLINTHKKHLTFLLLSSEHEYYLKTGRMCNCNLNIEHITQNPSEDIPRFQERQWQKPGLFRTAMSGTEYYKMTHRQYRESKLVLSLLPAAWCVNKRTFNWIKS